MLAMLLVCCLSAPVEVTVNAETLTLGAIIPLPAGDPRAAIAMGYAPNAGLARRFTRHDLLSKVRSAGLAVDDLELPESILVRRQSQTLDADRVSNAVIEALQRRYPNSNATIVALEVPPVQTPATPTSITAMLPPRFDAGAPAYVKVDVRGAGFYRQVFVRTQIQLEAAQAVIVSSVSAHAPIRPEDVEWRTVPILDARTTVDSIESIAGMVAKRDLAAGETLTSDLLYAPMFVKKGSAVTVRATAGAIVVAATMRARTSGRLGETIPLEHLSGGGTTMARIIGPDLLEAIQGVK